MQRLKALRFRKKFLIYPRFQLTLILANTVVLLAVFSIISLQLTRALATLHQTGLDLNLSESHPYFKFITMQSHILISYLGWGFGFAAVISSFAILLISHRVAGPIVRLREYLKKISEEGVSSSSPLQFRDRDFFSEIPHFVNQAILRASQDKTKKPSDSP